MVDWKAVEKCLAEMFKHMQSRGINVVVMPKICCGLARGHLTEEETGSRVVELLKRWRPLTVDVIVVEYNNTAAPLSDAVWEIVGLHGHLRAFGDIFMYNALFQTEAEHSGGTVSEQPVHDYPSSDRSVHFCPATKKRKKEEDECSDATVREDLAMSLGEPQSTPQRHSCWSGSLQQW